MAKFRIYTKTFIFTALLISSQASLADDSAWDQVKRLLNASSEMVVLDGIHQAPLKSPASGPPQDGGWLVRHLLSDPVTFNPCALTDDASWQVQANIIQHLLHAEPEAPYQLHGELAIGRPKISADKRRYSFTLRPEARFSDGQPVTAADVLFSVKALMNPKVLSPAIRSLIGALSDVQLESPHTITFICPEPYFLNEISLGFYLPILAKHFYDPNHLLDSVPVQSLIDGSWENGPHLDPITQFAEAFNQNFKRHILGSGPYLIADSATDVVTQQKVILSRNLTYWGRGNSALPPSGHVDKIVFKIINNRDAAFIELTNGNLDFYGLQPLEFKEKSWSPSFTQRFLKAVRFGNGYTYIAWNNRHPLFKDRHVRQAMSHLIDRQSMVDNLLFGLGQIVAGPISKFRPEYNHDLVPYPYDPDQALDLLTQAGWQDRDDDGILDNLIDGERIDFEFEFMVNSGNQIRKDIALVLQNELADIGIVCHVRELDWSIFLEKKRNQDYAALSIGIGNGNPAFPPDLFLMWHSSQADNGLNAMAFIHPQADRLIEAYRREFDPAKRIDLYRSLQEIIHAEQPITFLWQGRSATAYSRRFRNVHWYPDGANPLEWWVADEDRSY